MFQRFLCVKVIMHFTYISVSQYVDLFLDNGVSVLL